MFVTLGKSNQLFWPELLSLTRLGECESRDREFQVLVYDCANRMTGEEGGCLDRLWPVIWAPWPVMSLCANFIQPP